MSSEQIFQSLSHEQRIKVLDLTLPGIESFLKDILAKENLSEEVESLRRRYLQILDDSTRTNSFNNDSNNIDDLQQPKVKDALFAFNDNNSAEIYTFEEDPIAGHEPKDDEKTPARSRTSRKGTDSTEESGVFFATQFLPSVSSDGQDASNPRHSDTFESVSSRDTFMSDSEVEFLEWDPDLMEDGYSTGDNMDLVLPHIDLQANGQGELYAGVLYIREQPGWHKRWFVITETCLKCYKYKKDEKMLFEIPLRDARFVRTDRKRSRMYAITLSIARIKDDITFATTDEKSRQEWVYVINHVIKKLTLKESGTNTTDANGNREMEHQNDFPKLDTCVDNLQEHCDLSKRNSCQCDSDKEKDVLDQTRAEGEVETRDLKITTGPSLAREEAFKDLQESLPDILTRPKSKSWKGDLSKTDKEQDNAQYRKSISFSPSADSHANEDSSSAPRVKRHGSLANSLTNKAARVRSKLTTSFFKKGKREDKFNPDNPTQSTIFSGYLSRKKGGTWKNRWCVVRDNCFYCYKEFGANLPELETTLEGCRVESLPEKEEDKPNSFVLIAEKDRLHFAAENDAELEEWLDVLEKETKTSGDHDINVYPLDENIPPSLTPREIETSETAVNTNHMENDTKETQKTRKDKDSPKGTKDKVERDSGKRSTLLGAIAHKLGKHSSKSNNAQEKKLEEIARQIEEFGKETGNLEGGRTNEEAGPSKEGVLYGQFGNRYIECKVKLQNHMLEVEPMEQSVDETFKSINFRLINCIVLDCSDTDGPLAMVVKRNIGDPLYLQAHSFEEYQTWKEQIVSASLTTPSSIERLLPNKPSNEAPLDLKDEVFHRDSSTDVHSSQSANENDDAVDAKVNHIRRAYSAGGIDRLRSLHQGYLVYSKKKQSPIRRTISNAINSLDLAPKKHRSKTFAGLSVNAALLLGIKYSSSVYLRVSKEQWVQRWCVVQDNNLHFFDKPDDLSPHTSIQLSGCSVEEVNIKGKRFTFKLFIPSEKADIYFAVGSENERKAWVELLKVEGQRLDSSSNTELDIVNGVLLSRVKSENNILPSTTTRHTLNTGDSNSDDKSLRSMSKSLSELGKITREDKENLEDNNGDSIKSSSVLTQRPTSLQEVLQLLQEQQLMQSMGHQRYVRVKKARGNWKRSAAAVLKDSNSNPESPEAPRKPSLNQSEEITDATEPEVRGKPRGASTGSTHSNELPEDLSTYETSGERLGKMAEEEKLKALKNETLLRKRRNSLSLEIEVLEKKLGKEEKKEKKTGVKKLLGKEVQKDEEEITRTKKRLGEVKLKLADIDHDMEENKTKKAAAIENITALKTRSLRKASGMGETLISDHASRSLQDERRTRYRESPTGSTSSRDSFDDKTDVYRTTERSGSLHRKGSKNKASQKSLKALEEELLKISPHPSRKKRGVVKRVSSSSEGSIDDFPIRLSPLTQQRSSSSDVNSDTALSQSHDKLFGWDNVELKKKNYPSSSPHGELRAVAVHIPTESCNDGADGSKSSVPKGGDHLDHRPSLITALSQIKDFEEFLEINRRR